MKYPWPNSCTVTKRTRVPMTPFPPKVVKNVSYSIPPDSRALNGGTTTVR